MNQRLIHLMRNKAFYLQFSTNDFQSLSHQVDRKLDEIMVNKHSFPYWIHFESPSKSLKHKLSKKFFFQKSTRLVFFADEVRSRCVQVDGNIIFIVHSISTDTLHEESDFPSLRILITKDYILTISTGKIDAIETLRKSFASMGKINPYVFLSFMIEYLMNDLEEVIHFVDEKLYRIESRKEYGRELVSQLVSVRQDITYIRRYVFPQRHALITLINKLHSVDIEILNVYRALADNMTRHSEAIEMLKERATVMQDHLTNHLADVTNQRIYVLTVIMLIFTPAFFIMSLFSMYIPIPGMNNDKTWWIICGVIAAISYIVYRLFKKKNWI